MIKHYVAVDITSISGSFVDWGMKFDVLCAIVETHNSRVIQVI